MLTGVLWKYATGAFAILAIVLFLLLQAEKIHSAKVEKRAEYYRSELVRITEARDQQKVITKGNVDRVKVITRTTDERAKRVESAPVSQDCRTPEAVLQADL